MDLIVEELKNRTQKIYQFHEIDTLALELDQKQTKQHDLVFVTGNKNKVEELNEHIGDIKSINLIVLDLDLPEIQDANVLNIVREKCRTAFEKVNGCDETRSSEEKEISCKKKSVLIEDTCLHFNAYNGMPGPYIKWFLKALGPSGLHKMLAGFEDDSAEAVCIYALMEEESKISFFRGSVRGRIVAPRGASWGWDPVFEEERSGMTYGEMDPSMKFKFSHRSNAITVMKKYLSLGQV